MATIRKGNSLNNTAERYQNKMLDDVAGFYRQACLTMDSDLFNPTQATKRKHRFLPLIREKSMGMERNAYAWTFRGARCHLGRLYSQMGRLYAKKKVLENTST